MNYTISNQNLVIEISDHGAELKSVKYNKAAIKKYKVSLVPTLVFLDKEGNTIKKTEGMMKSDEIIEVLNRIK